MIDKYQPQEFEKKWVEIWEKEKTYQTRKLVNLSTQKPKQYVLSMFPYLSGVGLHVGHVRIYTGTDVLARFFRMNGYPVLHPMGWDAFGLPAENAAIKAKKNPMDMVPENIKNFKRQMKMLGFSYDWEKEFSTTDPEYYRWTQWLFIQFFKMGLLYKKEIPVYYCPSCKTGLAEEEVLPDGTHERCGKPITRKTLPQWLFKITSYADKLLEDLKDLDWPEGILEMQKNWIGKSEGTEIKFEILNPKSETNSKSKIKNSKQYIRVFTTRADTLFGVTALVVAPEHWLIDEILNPKSEILNKSQISNSKIEEIKKYVEEAKRKLDLARTDLAKEKTGVDTGLKAVHPLTEEKIPIWVADYVIGWYGEGAVMVVPGHDERDYEFAKKFNLPIKQVIINAKRNPPTGGQNSKLNQNLSKAFTDYGILINSGEFSGLTSKEAIEKITEKLQSLNLGQKKITYKLRDWIFSRQRYWGEPIPMIFCANCAKNQAQNSKFKVQNKMYGWFPVSENELPLKLPYIKSYEPTETGESPLAKISEFVNTTCPNCGGPAKRETDTMPNWAGSCWYFLAFAFSKALNSKSKIPNSKQSQNSNDKNSKSFENLNFKNSDLFRIWNLEFSASLKHWLPVDWYLGGAEHAVLHLLYSRFWVKALYDLGLLDFKEPFLRLRNVGMVLAEDHRKMSKSFGNVINPDDVVAEYGADALRLYEMFMAPFSSEIAWSTKALQGCYRFLKRVWETYQKLEVKNQKLKVEEDKELVAKLNKTIKKVTEDIGQIKFNTAIASMMEFLNEYEKKPQELSKENAKKFLQILAPFAPFLTEEIWREVFGEKESIHLSKWPQAEEVEESEIIIPVQVNGKLRGTIKVKSQKSKVKSYIEAEVLKQEKIKKYLQGKKYKMIYVEGKVVNLVVGS
ncbi:MAG: leucine--tRNA ligase [Patescibacteria group bacterium]|nr:leucine--tRNA ligase [Patescibacteria group bacterium]